VVYFLRRVEKVRPLFRPMIQPTDAAVSKDNQVRCTICGKRFRPFNRRHHLCSYECRDAFNLQHKTPTDRPIKECKFCGEQFMPDRATQNYCNRSCWAKAKSAESKAARRVWWRVGRPTLRELEEAGIDSAGARRRWNSPIKKKSTSGPNGNGNAEAEGTPEERKAALEALDQIMKRLLTPPKFPRRI